MGAARGGAQPSACRPGGGAPSGPAAPAAPPPRARRFWAAERRAYAERLSREARAGGSEAALAARVADVDAQVGRGLGAAGRGGPRGRGARGRGPAPAQRCAAPARPRQVAAARERVAALRAAALRGDGAVAQLLDAATAR